MPHILPFWANVLGLALPWAFSYAASQLPLSFGPMADGLRLSICHGLLKKLGIYRCFLPPSTTSKACWESYQSLIGNFLHGFDIQTACGYHPEWISKGCMNMTSKREFESLIPESKLQEVKLYCNQSLENSSACELCTKSLLSLGDSYLMVLKVQMSHWILHYKLRTLSNIPLYFLVL